MNCPFELRIYNYQFLNWAVQILSIYSQEEENSAEVVVPKADDWVAIMDADNREEESGEQLDDAASEAEMESHYGRGSVPGTAAKLNSCTCPAVRCTFMAKQVIRDVPDKPEEEAKPADNANKCKGKIGCDGQKSYPCKLFMKGCCARGEQCQFDHSGDPKTTPACRDFLNGKCKTSRYDCKYRHISNEENDKEKAEMKKNRSWNH